MPVCIAALGCAPPLGAQTPESADLGQVQIAVGRGQVRSIHGLTRSDFENTVTGSSPLLSMARLPGVSFSAADTLGNYEWSTRIAVRGFSQNQLGFTLDDVPLGDMSYANYNGLHISRAISSENVARAFVSQGSGALETASSSNLGGTLQFYSGNPLKDFGLQVQESAGSNNHRRHFVRLDSGDSAMGQWYASYTQQRAAKWKGSGEQRQTQWNLKFVKEWTDNRFSAFFNTSERREMDYQDMSLEMIQRLGERWDNFYPDFGAALAASRTLCGNGASTYVSQCDDAYYAGAGLRDDYLGAATWDTRLSDDTRLKATAYRHGNRGSGLWYTPYTASPDGTPLSLRTTEYDIQRSGLVTVLDYATDRHQFKLGYWHEANVYQPARRFYATSPPQVPGPYDYPVGSFATVWQYRFNLRTDQLSFSDSFAALPNLTLAAGFKALRVSIDGVLESGTGKPTGSIVAQSSFLPQLGLTYQLSPSDELFVSAARNMRAFPGTATGAAPFATTDTGFAAIKDTLQPETSETLEGGWRSQGPHYQGTLTAYSVRFHNRLLAVQPGAGIVGNPMVLSNVGSVHSTGLEAALSLRLAPGVFWYSSASHSGSTYQDDVQSDGVRVATSGKQVVDTPQTLLKSTLGYDDGRWFASLEADYMAKRYYTYLHDAAVPARTLVNLGAGYRWKSWGQLSDISLRAQISNLGNASYVATLGSNDFSNSDRPGTNQTLLPGAPRSVYLTLSARL